MLTSPCSPTWAKQALGLEESWKPSVVLWLKLMGDCG